VSQTSAAGSGGSAAPGWYTDPHDPSGLRWWSGEGWTEHVSGGSAGAAAAGVADASGGAQGAAGVDPQSALPSRRALRDPATEASEAAEAALRAQAAQQQAQAADAQAQAAQQAQAQAAQQAQAQAAQQAQDAQQAQAAQQQAALAAQAAQQSAPAAPTQYPPTAQPVQQQSPPVPTLPVASTSFLEQQGYAPLDSAPADPNAWGQPEQAAQAPQAAPVQPVQPQAAPVQSVPVQSVPVQSVPVQSVPAQSVQPAQPNAWNQPLQPTQPTQPAQPIAPAQPNAWNQPVQPTQPGWGAPSGSSDGLDALFGGSPAEASGPDSQPGQWGLTPTGTDGDSRRSPEVDEVRGSSTFWAWLIAISPILAAGSVIYVLLSTKSALTDWPFEAAVAAPYVLVLLFALADRSVLTQLGHSRPRSPAWALLSAPVYLIARAGETRAEDGSGTALTLAWFVSVLVAVGGIVGYGFLTGHALIAGLPT
jgi:Protein of unknown function (DUF2510)